MTAQVPAIDAQALAQSDRERDLLERIAQLEAKLQVPAGH